jgi:hypothetical protein
MLVFKCFRRKVGIIVSRLMLVAWVTDVASRMVLCYTYITRVEGWRVCLLRRGRLLLRRAACQLQKISSFHGCQWKLTRGIADDESILFDERL